MTYAQAREALFRLKGVSPDGTGRRQWGAFTDRSNYTAGGQARDKSQRPGFYDTKYGVAPTEAEVQAFWRANGGGRASQRRGAPPAGSAPAGSAAATAAGTSAPASGSSYTAILRELAAAEQKALDDANAANEARFARIDQSKGDLYGRVMGEVDNWGNVQSQLNAENAQRQIDAAKANAAERGLANSNVVQADTNQINRNLGLIQQDLSERKSDRRIGYDVNLTNDRDAFVERKYDNAPDQRDLMAIYAKLGEAEAMEKARTEAATNTAGRTPTKSRRLPQIQSTGGVSPAYAQMLASQMQGNFLGGILNGMTPGQIGAAMVARNTPAMRPSWTSNAYPHRRGESRDEAYYRRVNG